MRLIDRMEFSLNLLAIDLVEMKTIRKDHLKKWS